MAPEGEFKLHGCAMDIQDTEQRRHYGEALYTKIGWRPVEPQYHLFALDIQSAGFLITAGDARLMQRWRAGEQVTTFRQNADGRLVLVP
jgi:hypothetical protein